MQNSKSKKKILDKNTIFQEFFLSTVEKNSHTVKSPKCKTLHPKKLNSNLHLISNFITLVKKPKDVKVKESSNNAAASNRGS